MQPSFSSSHAPPFSAGGADIPVCLFVRRGLALAERRVRDGLLRDSGAFVLDLECLAAAALEELDADRVPSARQLGPSRFLDGAVGAVVVDDGRAADEQPAAVVRRGVERVRPVLRDADEPVVLQVNNRVFAKGEIVDVDGYYGVQISEISPPAQRIASLGD